MNLINRFSLFDPLDFAAVGLTLLVWLLVGWRVENPSANHLSVTCIMAEYRRELCFRVHLGE